MSGRRLAVALLAAALGVTSCGGGGGSAYKEPAGKPIATLHFTAGNIFFKPKTASAPAGVVQIDVSDDAGIHTFQIHEIKDFKLDLGGAGRRASGKVQLEAGKTYRFYCSIPGHEAGGMKGTITVA